MRSSVASRSLGYVLGLVVIAALTAVLVALRDMLDTTVVTLLYLIPLGMVTAFWGLGPGMASALAAFLALNY